MWERALRGVMLVVGLVACCAALIAAHRRGCCFLRSSVQLALLCWSTNHKSCAAATPCSGSTDVMKLDGTATTSETVPPDADPLACLTSTPKLYIDYKGGSEFPQRLQRSFA